MHLVYACTFAHMYVLMCLCVCVCMYIKTNIGGGWPIPETRGTEVLGTDLVSTARSKMK